MATILDASGLVFLLPVFVFILVFSIVFAILEVSKIFGEGNRTLNVAAALSIAALSLFTGKFVALIAIIVPWIIFLAVVMFLLFAIFGFFDIGKERVWGLFGQMPIFILILIIVIIGLSMVFESSLSPYQQTNDTTSTAIIQATTGENISTSAEVTNPREQTIKTLTNPRMLGAIFMLVIAAAAMRYLVDKYEIPKE
jgi:hypothetical protein